MGTSIGVNMEYEITNQQIPIIILLMVVVTVFLLLVLRTQGFDPLNLSKIAGLFKIFG